MCGCKHEGEKQLLTEELSFWLLWCTLISYYHIASLYTWEIPFSFLYMSHKYQSKHMLFRYSYCSGILLSTPFFWCFCMHRNMWFDCFGRPLWCENVRIIFFTLAKEFLDVWIVQVFLFSVEMLIYWIYSNITVQMTITKILFQSSHIRISNPIKYHFWQCMYVCAALSAHSVLKNVYH